MILGPLVIESENRVSKIALEMEAPGLAFWRDVPDIWAYGAISVEINLNQWSFPGFRLFWFNGADPSPKTSWWMLHFNWYDTLRIWLGGPVSVRFLYVDDRRN